MRKQNPGGATHRKRPSRRLEETGVQTRFGNCSTRRSDSRCERRYVERLRGRFESRSRGVSGRRGAVSGVEPRCGTHGRREGDGPFRPSGPPSVSVCVVFVFGEEGGLRLNGIAIGCAWRADAKAQAKGGLEVAKREGGRGVTLVEHLYCCFVCLMLFVEGRGPLLCLFQRPKRRSVAPPRFARSRNFLEAPGSQFLLTIMGALNSFVL
jgi:hypothetical protein